MNNQQCVIQTYGTTTSERYLDDCLEIYCIKCAIPMCKCDSSKVYCCHCLGCIDLLKNFANQTVRMVKIVEKKLHWRT